MTLGASEKIAAVRRSTWLPWTVVWLAFVPLAISRAGMLAESDTFWEARTGLRILATGQIPTTDPFSWTAAGWPWYPNSWAFDVLLGLGYKTGGLAAVALVGSALVMLVAAAMVALARRLGAPSAVAAFLMPLGALLIADWLAARPQLIDYAAVPLLVILLETALSSTGLRWWCAVAGVTALHMVWANLHTAAPLGIVVALAWCFGHLIRILHTGGVAGHNRYAVLAGRYSALLISAVAGTVANPFGFGIFLQVVRVHAATPDIAEWRPLRFADPTSDILLLLAVAAVGTAWWWRRWDLAAVIAALTAGAVVTVRLLPIAVVVALPVLAAAFAQPRLVTWLARRRHLLRVGAILLAAAMSVVAATSLTHLGRPKYPLDAVQALPAGCRLFNGYLLGGPVILLRPDVPVSQDSRTDLYGTAELRSQTQLMAGPPDVSTRLRRLGVTCVLIPGRSGLAARLRADPTWLQETGNPVGVLFVLRQPVAGAPVSDEASASGSAQPGR